MGSQGAPLEMFLRSMKASTTIVTGRKRLELAAKRAICQQSSREPGVKPFDCFDLLIKLEIVIWLTYKSHLPGLKS